MKPRRQYHEIKIKATLTGPEVWVESSIFDEKLIIELLKHTIQYLEGRRVKNEK